MPKQPSLNLRKKIEENRPELSSMSVETYIISLRMLYKKFVDNDESKLSEQINTKFLHDFDAIMKIINDMPKITTQKNRLTSILVALDSDTKPDHKLIDRYQAKLKDFNKTYTTFLNKQEKTETQKDNWISYDTFLSIINKLLEKITEKGILKKKGKLSKADYSLLQKYVVLRLYQNFPIRNDVANMKVLTRKEYDDLSEDDRDLNNYLIKDSKDKYVFQLNVFKNVHRIGTKTLKIPSTLQKLIKKFLTYNTSGWFLTLQNGIEPMSSNGITKILNSIFKEYAGGKKISTSLLRHISISHDTMNDPTIKEQQEKDKKISDRYLHSAGMNKLYRKIDD